MNESRACHRCMIAYCARIRKLIGEFHGDVPKHGQHIMRQWK